MRMTSKRGVKLCRLCLCEGHHLMDIFSGSSTRDFSVEETIQDLLKFKAVQSPDFPWLVCSSCMTKLTEFRLFKQQCQECKMTFESRFIGVESRIKEEEVGNAKGSDGKSLTDASVQRDEEVWRNKSPMFNVPQGISVHSEVSVKEERTEDRECLTSGIADETEDEPRPESDDPLPPAPYDVSLKEEGMEDSECLSSGIVDETEDEPGPIWPQLKSVVPLPPPTCHIFWFKEHNNGGHVMEMAAKEECNQY